jgi:glycosyltransferase involved in cell wall biosynthesis
MKFLLCNWRHKEEVKGGCETIFSELSEMLNEMGHETKLVSFNNSKKTLGIGLEKEGMAFFEVEASHVIDLYCKRYQELYPDTWIISNAGIVNFWYKHANVINIFNDPYKTLVDKLLRIGFYGSTTYNKYGNIMVRMQQEGACGATNIAISDFMVNEMSKIGVEPDITIPHGIDLELFKPMDKKVLREKYGIPKGMKVVVWSKDFHPVAGFHIISELIKKRKDIFWVLNFKLGNNGRIKAKNVKILQPVEREMMPEIYNLGDFLINPSVIESFGLVPLEAMACGIPCVVANTGFVWEKGMKGVEERQYGVLVNPWNAESYEKAIDMLLAGNIGRFEPRKFAEQFSKEKWKQEWKKAIEELCKTKIT